MDIFRERYFARLDDDQQFLAFDFCYEAERPEVLRMAMPADFEIIPQQYPVMMDHLGRLFGTVTHPKSPSKYSGRIDILLSPAEYAHYQRGEELADHSGLPGSGEWRIEDGSLVRPLPAGRWRLTATIVRFPSDGAIWFPETDYHAGSRWVIIQSDVEPAPRPPRGGHNGDGGHLPPKHWERAQYEPFVTVQLGYCAGSVLKREKMWRFVL